MPDPSLLETFPALTEIDGLVHGFTLRHPQIDVKTDREVAVDRLEEHFRDCLSVLSISRGRVATGQQVHGNRVEVVAGVSPAVPGRPHFPDTDGLATAVAGQFLGIFVADCGAVFIADPVRRACAMLHSGRKGTELGITPVAIRKMREEFGSDPADLVVQLSPCIRPPAYEIDFAATIVSDAIAAGVPESQVHDCGICTTSDPDRYYSYRLEKGKTGRLFGVIGWSA